MALSLFFMFPGGRNVCSEDGSGGGPGTPCVALASGAFLSSFFGIFESLITAAVAYGFGVSVVRRWSGLLWEHSGEKRV